MPESVYISSTYNDLKNFRQAIINCIVSLGDYYRPVSMEFYDAEDKHFVKKCLDDVEACNIYILILGNRFGYIPDGFTKSITELEYEKARDCKLKGMVKEILVFKVGELCNTYTYNEADPKFVKYNQDFLNEINERLSPKPFDSEAELSLQVSLSLMKRLFKLIRNGAKIIPPDKDAVLCYCDRNIQINSLKRNVLINKKKIFFTQGNRLKDFPGGIVKRFAKYSLGSVNKIEPFLKITDLVTSNDMDSNRVSFFWNILDYLSISSTAENTTVEGFIKELAFIKSKKIILPFYYDFDLEEDSNKFSEFLDLTELVFREHGKEERPYELYFIIIVYSPQPDYDTIKAYIEKFTLVKSLSVFIEKLKPVTGNDIIDWIEKYITTIDFSASLYNEYFNNGAKDNYNMQEVNLTLGKIIEDLENGNEMIMKYI